MLVRDMNIDFEQLMDRFSTIHTNSAVLVEKMDLFFHSNDAFCSSVSSEISAIPRGVSRATQPPLSSSWRKYEYQALTDFRP